MNLEEQILEIRKKRHQDYLKYRLDTEKEKNEELKKKENEELILKKINILMKLSRKYKHFFSSDKYIKAAIIIQKFVRKYYFEPQCINLYEMENIPILYRLRINITENHVNEYTEKGIGDDMIGMHRLVYKMLRPTASKNILFRYCFDIRTLFFMKDEIIELYDGFFFMQPTDHTRINSLWKKVNGETDQSIMYLSNLEYYKSLSIDKYRNNNVDGQIMFQNIKQTVPNKETDTEINDISLDNEYVDELNRQYINEDS